MKILKVIVDKKPAQCIYCPFYGESCGTWERELGNLIGKKLPDARCKLEEE